MASFEQDLEDDDEFLMETTSTNGSQQQQQQSSSVGGGGEEWTCKKCTLVNSPRVKACVVCGGSKLKSISSVEDMTLRKGEFWSCAQCTLKNSLSASACSACKSIRQIPIISGQQTNFRPYTSTPGQPNPKPSFHHHNRQILATIVPGTPSSSGSSSSSSSTPSGSGGAGGGGVGMNNSLVPPVNRISRSPSPKHDRSGGSGAIPKVKVNE